MSRFLHAFVPFIIIREDTRPVDIAARRAVGFWILFPSAAVAAAAGVILVAYDPARRLLAYLFTCFMSTHW